MSLSLAAAELHVTPAAVSRQVKLLEDVIGFALFERNHRAIKLTTQGERYLADIAPAFDLIDKATARLRAQKPRETLSIQAYTTIALRWLIPRMSQFHASHPALHVQISASLKPVSFDTQSIDGAIMVGHDASWPGLHSTRLLGIKLTPVCSPRLWEKLKGHKGSKALQSTPLLHSMARKRDWGWWLDAAGWHDVDAQGGLRFENSSMAYQAAIEGIGIAIAQPEFVEADIAEGRLMCPFSQVVVTSDSYYFIVPHALAEERKVRLFCKWLQNSVKGSFDTEN